MNDDFDAWQANPYTKALQKSLVEDYVPREPWTADVLRSPVREALAELVAVQGDTMQWDGSSVQHEQLTARWAKAWAAARAVLAGRA